MSQIIPIPLKFSNSFLIKGRKAILVDSGSPRDVPALLGAMGAAGVPPEDLSLMLHTHAHFDHCGCTATLRGKSNAVVAIHGADAEYLAAGENAPMASITLFGRILLPILATAAAYPPVSPDIQFEDEFDLRPYGVDGKAIATPGHTHGSVAVVLDNGDVIAGDLIGGGKLLGLIRPRRPRYHHWYIDFPVAKASLSRILSLNPRRIFVGHGGPLTGSAAKTYFSNRM